MLRRNTTSACVHHRSDYHRSHHLGWSGIPVRSPGSASHGVGCFVFAKKAECLRADMAPGWILITLSGVVPLFPLD